MARRSDPVDIRVGQRIRAYRLSKRITQTELGEKVGVTFQQIQKYELGTNRVGSSRLKRIASALRVPISSLFGDDETAQGQAADEFVEFLAQPHAARLLRAFSTIKDAKKRVALLHIAEVMAD